MAAHRLARHLARIRTGDEEPGPAALRAALRDVVRHCIYGVDINPMAVELCKVALWMETLDPGKPLSFLDRNIQCGNSLVGATPRGLEDGIPDAAFAAVTGDDKAYCSEFKKLNKKEREQQALFTRDLQPWERLGNLAAGMAQLDATDDDTLPGVQRQEALYEELVRSSDYRYGRLLADAWCAAFVWQKTKAFAYPITEQVFRAIERNPFNLAKWMETEIERLREQYQFFHWHLAFPHVFTLPQRGETPEHESTGWHGGFDVVLGNPPWNTLSPDVKEFFSVYHSGIRSEDATGQTRIMNELLVEPAIADHWATYCRELYVQANLFRNGGRYVLFAPGDLGKGDFNVYRIFTELALQITRIGGRCAQILPEGLYNGSNSMAIRQAFFEQCTLDCVFGFENAGGIWFPGIHRSQKFCIYSASRGGCTTSFRAAFSVRSREQLSNVIAGKSLVMPVSLVREFSPDALAIMELGSQLDIDIVTKMYRRWPKFGDEHAGPPHRLYMREIDMGNDRELFSEDNSGLPVYEGRMVDQYDHRAKGYRFGRGRTADWEELPFGNPRKSIQPQWFIPTANVPHKIGRRISGYRIGFCDVASPTNERTLVAALLPPGCIAGHKVPTITFDQDMESAYLLWLAVANSFTMDFLARKKVSLSMTYTLLDSLPFPRLSADHPIVSLMAPLILKLTCTGPEMNAYWNAMAAFGWVETIALDGPPPGLVDEHQRLRARAEIEALVARDLYGLSKDETAYVLDAFPTVRRRDEEAYGEYRTRRLVLEAWDRLEEELGPVVVCNYRTSEVGNGEVGNREVGATPHHLPPTPYSLRQRPQFGAIPAPAPAAKPAPVAEPEPDAGQRDLFGEPVAPVSQPAKAKPAPAKPESVAQPVLIFAPPQGSYTERLSRVMALRANGTPEAISEVVAALGDEDERIRWLAGSVLQSIGGETLIATLRAFVRQAETDVAWEEAERVLGKLVGEG